MADDSTKAQLKKLRNELAVQAPRARTYANAPADVVDRLHEIAERISSVYLASCETRPQRSEAFDELCDDVLVEGHLVLKDWSQWVEQQQQKRKPTPPPTAERRVHERVRSTVSIMLRRHDIRGAGTDLAVFDQSVDRPTRDVSSGGAFVLAPPGDLPGVATGHVVHVSLPGTSKPRDDNARGVVMRRDDKARAVVVRRDDTGIALRWIVESPVDQRVVDAIVAAIREGKP